MRSFLGSALTAAAILTIASAPAEAQLSFSNSYTFLKAVKERDGDKVTDLLSQPSTYVINTQETDTGNAALHIVTRDRDITWLNFLLGKGAKADIENEVGETPLIIASQIGWIEGADALLSRGAGVNFANGRGETPLIRAVQRRHVAMGWLLLARGANPKHSDSVVGYSALDYARQDGRASAVLKLLEGSATAKPAREMAGPKL